MGAQTEPSSGLCPSTVSVTTGRLTSLAYSVATRSISSWLPRKRTSNPLAV